jgi:phage/plasmid primase-like uncharacterized protein
MIDPYLNRIAIGRRFGSLIAAENAFFLAGDVTRSGLPCTVTDGERRHLSGMNCFVLLQVMKDQGWTDSRFFTADQVKQAGWSILPNAKRIGLQFLASNGPDGLPLETPYAKVFHVFNASEISGVTLDGPVPSASVNDLETAATRAGFTVGPDGLQAAVDSWLLALQAPYTNALELSVAQLKTRLASSVLKALAGFEGKAASSSELCEAWAQRISGDPLSFYQAVKSSHELVAVVMGQVKAIQKEREVMQDLARSHEFRHGVTEGDTSISGIDMNHRAGNLTRQEAGFLDRAAVLAVPYADKDRAKALGAVWYGPASSWFVPKGVDVSAFKSWVVGPQRLGPVASEGVLTSSFRDAMAGLGLDVSGNIEPDGKWHNVSVESYKGGRNKSGSYIFSLNGARDGSAIGTILNKHTGESFTWKHEGVLLTPEQRARSRVEASVRDASAALEVTKMQDIAAAHADEIWSAGWPANNHGYVIKKEISADGFRQVHGSVLLQYSEFRSEDGASIIREQDDYLIVPLTNAHGHLRGLQAINSDGSVKTFMRGAQKKGTMLVLGADSFDALARQRDLSVVPFVEGVSTGASFRAASGLPVVVCFDAGNLETVVAEMSHALSPSVVRVLAVDDDQFHVERAVGFLAEKLGLNPHAIGGQSVTVFSGSSGERTIGLGDAVADGQWQQSARGTYRVVLNREDDGCAVRSVVIDVVPSDGGRKMSATFVNRGVEAGRKAMESIAALDQAARFVMVMPEFSSLASRPTDWNDLAKIRGMDAVRAVLRGVEHAGIKLCAPAAVRSALAMPAHAQMNGISR